MLLATIQHQYETFTSSLNTGLLKISGQRRKPSPRLKPAAWSPAVDITGVLLLCPQGDELGVAVYLNDHVSEPISP